MQTSYQQYSDKALPGLVGQLAGTKNTRTLSNKNYKKNVWSYTVASDAETITIVTLPDADATQITVTTAAQGSAALTAAQHVKDINSSNVRFWMVATVSTATITLTGIRAGWEFEVTGTNIGTPSEDVEASDINVVGFGKAVTTSGEGVKVVSTASTKGVAEVTIDTAANTTAYTISVNSETITYTSGSSATTSSIRDGLINVINSNYALRNQVQAYVKDADEFYIEALNYGDSVTLTESDANISIVTTNATGITGDLAIGVSVRNHLIENDSYRTVSTDSYNADSAAPVPVLDEGTIWMTAKSSISAGDIVLASIASGYEGDATTESSDSVSFRGTVTSETSANAGELVRVRLK